jgi:hypothetical protein
MGNAGEIIPITVYILRKDGFKNEIELTSATPGFKINGGVIPVACEKINMTISLPNEGSEEPINLKLMGLATVDSKTIERVAFPADNTMQAFLYRHLLPAKEFAVFVNKKKKSAVKMITKMPIEFGVESKVKIQVQIFEPEAMLKQLQLKLVASPEGISLKELNIIKNGLEFDLLIDKSIYKGSISSNLIVEIIRNLPQKDKNGNNMKNNEIRVGFLPAISFVIK